jgi:hypothetical protein
VPLPRTTRHLDKLGVDGSGDGCDRRGYEDDPDAALDGHFGAHPEDRGANIVIFEF